MSGGLEVLAATAEETRLIGERLAPMLGAGDLVLLSGELGAGKTTFTQGLGAGLRVRGPVTSPTFVISRVHPSLEAGPPLVHVDAYRLGEVAELDDLDLDTSLAEAVTVVEWGEGMAEGLGEDRLEVTITRDTRDTREDTGGGGSPEDAEVRRLRFVPVGARWQAAALASVLT